MSGFSTSKGIFYYPLILVSFGCYLFVAYFLERHDTGVLILLFTLLFGIYLILVKDCFRPGPNEDDGYGNLASLGLLFRLSILFAIPNLSDDFYRFIWDGRLLNAGLDPFAELPSFYIETDSSDIPGITPALYSQLNSPEYFTIYPPVNQFIFWFSSLISGESILGAVVSMRLFLLASEIGNIWLFPKVLAAYQLPRRYSLLYWLNPLVIVEGVGNLHFEVMMLSFILLALWWLKTNKYIFSAVAMALAVGTKLIPLIFLPFISRPFDIKRITIYYGITGVSIAILFLPLISPELINGLQSSISLYYQKFEFNASIYFILRELGFQEYGYNRIEFIGKDLVKWTFWLIIILAFWPFGKRPKLAILFMYALGIYFLLSTTVHPWYVITLVGLSILTPFRSPLVWSYLIFLTYIGYDVDGFSLPVWILFLEYGIVLAIFLFELSRETGLIFWAKSRFS